MGIGLEYLNPFQVPLIFIENWRCRMPWRWR